MSSDICERAATRETKDSNSSFGELEALVSAEVGASSMRVASKRKLTG
jgi:hypothetical protein